MLVGGPVEVTPEQLGGKAPLGPYTPAQAKDEVFVVPLVDGGIISYRHADGRYLHTLGDQEGFARKLRQLGIAVPTGAPPRGG